ATLLRSLSHDLRTPLTTIKEGAELILNNPKIADSDKIEILTDISEKAEWTVRLVENLLSLTRINSDNLTVKKAPEAVEEIIPQAVRTIDGILGRRKIYYGLPKELLLVPMDATLVMQAISNILNNAIKHTADNGNIWINVFSSGKNAVFRISNDGEKIKDADIDHIFEMYFTTGDQKTGSSVGIGLAICKLIISAHGGEIEVRQDENKVTFEFNLPLEEKNA
ncbi:MAG: ATP-binding protein, partial [Clostridia bacterium]